MVVLKRCSYITVVITVAMVLAGAVPAVAQEDGADGADENPGFFGKMVDLEAAPEVLSNAVMEGFELLDMEDASGLQIATGVVDILAGLSGMIPHPAGAVIGALLGLASFFMKFGQEAGPVTDPVLEAIQNLYNQLSMKLEAVQNELTFQIETQDLNEAFITCRTKYQVMDEFANDESPDLPEYEAFVEEMARHDSGDLIHPRNALRTIHAKITGEVGVPIMATFLNRYSTSEDSNADTRSAKYWKQLQNANIMCGSVILSSLMMTKNETLYHSAEEFLERFNANLAEQHQFHYEMTDMYGREDIGSEYDLVFPLQNAFTLRDNGYTVKAIEITEANTYYVCTSAVNCPPGVYDIITVYSDWSGREERIKISGNDRTDVTLETVQLDDPTQPIAITYTPEVQLGDVYKPDGDLWIPVLSRFCSMFTQANNPVRSQTACQDACVQSGTYCCGINYSPFPSHVVDADACFVCTLCSLSYQRQGTVNFYARPPGLQRRAGLHGTDTVVLIPPKDLQIGGTYGWRDEDSYIRKLGLFWMPRPLTELDYLDLGPNDTPDFHCPAVEHTWTDVTWPITQFYKECGYPIALCTCDVTKGGCAEIFNVDYIMPSDTCPPEKPCYPMCEPYREVFRPYEIFSPAATSGCGQVDNLWMQWERDILPQYKMCNWPSELCSCNTLSGECPDFTNGDILASTTCAEATPCYPGCNAKAYRKRSFEMNVSAGKIVGVLGAVALVGVFTFWKRKKSTLD